MESLKSKAYEIIKKRIVSCEYAPGDILDEKALIDEFGVSRTPIREALNVLAEEGMVDIMPRRAILVSHISTKDVSNLYHLRLVLEPDSVKIAAEASDANCLKEFRERILTSRKTDIYTYSQLDSELHLYIAQCTQNNTLIRFMKILMDQTQRVRFLSSDFAERREGAYKEHLAIIDCLQRRGGDAAAQQMLQHICAAHKGMGLVYDSRFCYNV